jgi:hypothetical protein
VEHRPAGRLITSTTAAARWTSKLLRQLGPAVTSAQLDDGGEVVVVVAKFVRFLLRAWTMVAELLSSPAANRSPTPEQG